MRRARNEAPRGVRIGDRNSVAVTGCAPANCRADRVLLPIRKSGDALRALERASNPYPRS